MVKILNIISDTNIGGAGRVIENYLSCRDTTKFDVAVALPKDSLLTPSLKKLGARIYEIDGLRDKSFDLKAVSALKKVIKADDPDIVHTHGAFSGRIAGKQCGKTVVVTRHSAFPLSPKLKKFPFKQIYTHLNVKYADLIIAVSPVCRDYITDVGVPKNMTAVLINGVEPVPEVPPERVRALKEKLGVPDGVFTAGIIARLEPYKGHSYVLDAVKEVKTSGRNICVIAAGTGSLLEELRERVRAEGLSDSVLFPGFIEDTHALWPLLDAQINASYVEATSLALLEGMSAGVPAIVSDCGGNPDIITDGETGLIFPMRDAHRLAQCIWALIDDPDNTRRMGLNARLEYEKNYTAEAFSRRLEKIYLSLTGGRDGKR